MLPGKRAVLHIALTSGAHAWGLRYLEQAWPRFVRSPMWRTVGLPLTARIARLRSQLSHHFANGRDAAQLPRELRKDLAAVARACRTPRERASVDVQWARVEYADGQACRHRCPSSPGRAGARPPAERRPLSAADATTAGSADRAVGPAAVRRQPAPPAARSRRRWRRPGRDRCCLARGGPRS